LWGMTWELAAAAADPVHTGRQADHWAGKAHGKPGNTLTDSGYTQPSTLSLAATFNQAACTAWAALFAPLRACGSARTTTGACITGENGGVGGGSPVLEHYHCEFRHKQSILLCG
jgi:hypothetical protein